MITCRRLGRGGPAQHRVARLVTGLALIAPAAAPLPTSGPAAEAHTLVVGTTGLGNFAQINPLNSPWLLQGDLNYLLYVPLVRYAQEDYGPAPGLAVEWGHADDDPLTWTYRLDPAATWSDGEPVTAADVVFTFELLRRDPELHARNRELVDNVEAVEAVDDHTVRITIRRPSVAMQQLVAFVVPRHAWADVDEPAGNAVAPGQPTSGAFHLVEFSPGERVVLAANEQWWGGEIAYDGFELRNFESNDAMVDALIDGDVDLIGGLNPQQYERLSGVEHVTTSSGPGRRWHAISFNTGARTQAGEPIGDGHPALRDPAVRRAIHHVVDKDHLVDAVRSGHAVPGSGLVPPIFSRYAYDPGDGTVAVDAREGNRLLDDAGYTARDADGVRIDPASGRPLVFRLHHHAERPDYAVIAGLLAEWAAQLGIVLDPVELDTATVNELHATGRYDIAFSAWNVSPDPAGDLAYHTCARLPETAAATALTFSFWCDEDYDALYARQQGEADPDLRARLLREMVALAYDEAPQIELYYENQLEAYNSARWTSFETQPAAGGMIREQKGAYGYLSARPVG